MDQTIFFVAVALVLAYLCRRTIEVIAAVVIWSVIEWGKYVHYRATDDPMWVATRCVALWVATIVFGAWWAVTT